MNRIASLPHLDIVKTQPHFVRSGNLTNIASPFIADGQWTVESCLTYVFQLSSFDLAGRLC